LEGQEWVHAVGAGRIVLRLGDLCDYEGEVIVNAASNYFWMGSGVAGAIKRRGGDSIEREAMAQAPRAVGDAILTGAGRLPHSAVIHAAVMGQDLVTGSGPIRQAARRVFQICREKGFRFIGFPALGTGIGGFPLGACAEILLEEAREALETPDSPFVEVVFYLFDRKAYLRFVAVAGRTFARPLDKKHPVG
jgi:O-acetyl-ADP-ribose deacetylase (regulator of RNase III)